MPRTGRVVIPDFPHHIVQRGHNRQVVFARDSDYRRYLDDVSELKATLDIRVYAYCLMANHVHLLLAPQGGGDGLAKLMKALAARATRYRNTLELRTGTLWEGRYRSSPVQTDQYLLACVRYIEMNPVRARIAAHPIDYPWSSYQERMTGSTASCLDRDPCYMALGDSDEARRLRYARFVQDAAAPAELRLIRDAVRRGQLTGGETFTDHVQAILGRRIESRGRGRPGARGK